MKEIIVPGAVAKGRVRAYKVRAGMTPPPGYVGRNAQTRLHHQPKPVIVLPGIWEAVTAFEHNDILYDWATIVGKLLTTGDSAYRISGMYLEYKNVGSPSTPVTAPSFTRYDGIDYFNALSGSASVDYLRVPLVAATMASTDADKFPQGNLMTFFAQTSAAVGTGVHGKPFNDSAISKVYGGALVAIVDPADRTKDLVFSRFYFSSGNQQVKLAASQIGLEWDVQFE